MGIVTVIALLILIPLLLFPRGKPALAARLGANALIGAVAEPVATFAGGLFLAVITGSKFDLRSCDDPHGHIATVVLVVASFAIVFIGGFIGALVGALGRGLRVVTFWNCARVFLGGCAGVWAPIMVVFMLLAPDKGEFVSVYGGLSILGPVGLFVGMSVSTTRPPDSDQPTRWPKPPAGRSPGNGTGASRADTHCDAERK
jgi:hypothetical protein